MITPNPKTSHARISQSAASDPAVTDRSQPRFCNLGSGSGGNASVLRIGGQTLLLDAGFGPRTTAQRLAMAGLTLCELTGIVLTHLDQDHFRKTWVRAIADLNIPLYLHAWHAQDLAALPLADRLNQLGLIHTFDTDAFTIGDALTAAPIRLQHDRQGTIGYRIHDGRTSVGFATDLGHAPKRLVEHFVGVDLLAIESNYDPQMQRDGDRPIFVKRRCMSDSGHLSNEQAFEAVCAIDQQSPTGQPARVVLLHASRQCNHPGRIERVFRQNPSLWKRTTLTRQRRRTRWLSVEPAKPALQQQLTLGW